MDLVDVIRRVEGAYNAADYDTLRTLIAPDIVCHTPGSQDATPGIQGCIESDAGGWSAFPDKRTEVLDAFAEGDKVVARIRMTGTNTGGLPWFGIPANGNPVDVQWIQISRHAADGTVVETWAQMDLPTLMQQLGAMPGPEGM